MMCQEIKEQEIISYAEFKNGVITDINHYIEFYECCFEKIAWKGKSQVKSFQNVIFKQCDFSNVNMYGANFISTIFENCNLIGADMSCGTFINTTINHSLASYSNFNGSSFKHCMFLENDLLEASFSDCKLEQVKWSNNRLIKADFNHTKLVKMDFRNNQIDGISVGIDDLKGLIITTNQAIGFISLLGIKIKEEQNESDTD